MKKILYFYLLIFVNHLHPLKLDVVSSFTLAELVPRNIMTKETGFKIRYFRYDFDVYYNNFYKPDVDKILIMAYLGDGVALSKIPIEKRVLLLWEAPGGKLGNDENQFSRVYTFNDDVIDNTKYFKFYYPVLIPMITSIPSFDEKKFCVMMTHRFTPERCKILKFFESKPFEELEYYGFESIAPSPLYRGQIPGHPVCNEKLEVLKQFKYCMCFENHDVNGYITEKIFTCFAAGCVPVYWGASNIEEYIPKDCFINYKDFSSDEDLYQFLKSLTKEEHERYVQNITSFLKSEKAHLFSAENFSKIFKDCALN